MAHYTIRKLRPANPKNPRGKRTWAWKFRDGRQIPYYTRHKGEIFGGHFHKGEDPSKNPEYFLLLFGSFRITFMTRSGKILREVIDASRGPIEVVVYPNLYHTLKAIKDCGYIEYRVTHFNPKKPDTFRWDEFKATAPDPKRLPPNPPKI